MATNIDNWQQRVDWTLSAILWIGFGLSVFLSGIRQGATPGVTLATVFAGSYVVAMQVIPRRVRNTPQLGEALAIIGVVVALVGTALTGGIDSGYVIFLVAPAFFAGAFLGLRVGLETALLAAIGLVVVVAALDQPVLDSRVVESVALFVLIGLTMSQMRRILVEEQIRSDELAATTELRISRLETAHDLLQSLSNLASAAELNPVTVGQAALRDIAARVPFAAGQVFVTAGVNDVVAATRGEPDPETEPHEYQIRIAERTVGRLLLWPQPGAELAGWRESIELALQPVAIAFENSRLLQQIAHRAVRGERSRIARELHDDIGPSLASLGLSIDMAIHQFEIGPDLSRHLDATRRHITTLIETVRGAAADLREDETESVVEKAHFLAADVDADGPSVVVTLDERRPPRGSTAVEIKAILTEAFRNAVAHSGATTVTVQGVVDRDSGRIVVADNGTGFDPTATPPGHFGIVGMKERATTIDADLDVSSRPGVGTTVSISWGRRK
jgi:signal transduction histidine kinase